MQVIVFGANGATGKHAVEQLVKRGNRVVAVIRPQGKYPVIWDENESITIVKFSVATMDRQTMQHLVRDCDAVVSCLGHNLSMKGMFGKPRKLVTNTVKLASESVDKSRTEPFKVVLMNTAGNSNRDLNEKVSLGEKVAIGILRWLLPPHSDNENAADYLRVKIGQSHPCIEWVAVRPDSLTNEAAVSPYSVHPSPIRSALFNPGKTSRINVGAFMADLISDCVLWNKWKGKMPVVYND